ncbi:MAG: MBL fold metallo-hydrolase [Bacteroidales bacterium]|nr:MBL fold metallo-hydrolase [Bacteroidales bacterium]
MIKFKSLSSGSCGNCYFLGIYDDEGRHQCSVLIDAGVSLRRAKKELQRDGIAIEEISAILVTHDHMDHIRSLGSYCKKLQKPVWASETLHQALSHHSMTHSWIADCRHVLKKGETEIVPGHICAKHFIVPHDATQTIGYSLDLDGYRFVIMTDIGSMTPEALAEASLADTVVIESNYDLDMLRHGPYPKELQDRICQGNGHLSNSECADAIRKFIHPGLKNIFLCHLSEHNNTPELALQASAEAIGSSCASSDRKPRLLALPRQTPLQLTVL